MAWGFLQNLLQGDEKPGGGLFGFLNDTRRFGPSALKDTFTKPEVFDQAPKINIGDFKGSGLIEDFLNSPFRQAKGAVQVGQGDIKEGAGNVVAGSIEGPLGFLPVGRVAQGAMRGSGRLLARVGAGAKQGAKEGAFYGGVYGGADVASQDGSALDIAQGAGIGAGAGALFGATLGGASPVVGSVVKGSPEVPNAIRKKSISNVSAANDREWQRLDRRVTEAIKNAGESTGKLKKNYEAEARELIRLRNARAKELQAGTQGSIINATPEESLPPVSEAPQYTEIPVKGDSYIRIGNDELDRLTKATTAQDVKKVIGNDLPPDLVESMAPSLANVKDPNIIKNIIGNQAKQLVPDAPPPTLAEATIPPVEQLPIEPPTAVEKLTSAVQEARPQRAAIEKAYTQERGRRVAQSATALESNQGAGAFRKALRAQKGELLPDAPTVGNKLDKTDIDELADIIRTKQSLGTYEKISTWAGLQTIFKGKVPPESQLKLLEETFGSDLIKEVVKGNKTKTDRLRDFITETVNIPRVLITTLDMSAPLRQSVVLTTTRPLQALGAAKQAVKATFSNKNFEGWLDDLYASPEYKTMRDSKLYVADPRRVSDGLSGKEEAFMSNIVQKLPWVGASERNYITYLNKMRVDTFESMRRQLEDVGNATPENLKALANFVNTATGRGNLGKLEKVSRELNNVFFSPRLVKSRFDFLNPVWYAKQPAPIRKQAVKSFAGFVGVGLTVLGLMKAAGAEVQSDPRSSDFGKIKVGDTRWDVWGGYQQWARALTQFATGRRVTAEDILGPANRYDTAVNFATGKLAPTPATAVRLAKGENPFGENLSLKDEAIQNTIPIYLQDMKQVVEQHGPEGIFTVGIPAFFGVGTQSYKSTSNQDVSAKRTNEVTGNDVGSDFYTSLNKTLPERDRVSKEINKAISAQDFAQAQQLANDYNKKLIDGFSDWFKAYKGQQIPEELLDEFSRSTIKLNDRSIQGRVRTIQTNPVRYER